MSEKYKVKYKVGDHVECRRFLFDGDVDDNVPTSALLMKGVLCFFVPDEVIPALFLLEIAEFRPELKSFYSYISNPVIHRAAGSRHVAQNFCW